MIGSPARDRVVRNPPAPSETAGHNAGVAPGTTEAELGSPLRLSAFRRLWLGATISSIGDAATWIALVALALGRLHASLPLLAVFYTAPVAVGGLFSGWALDRFDRRIIMIADSLLRGIIVASLPIAAVLGQLHGAHLYVVAATYGALKMTSLAGFPSLIPSLVPSGLLTKANALEGVSFGLASLSGAALAGVAVATVGPAPVVAFDAATYFAFALALRSVQIAAPAAGDGAGSTGPAGTGFGPVVRATLGHPWLRDLTIMFALFNIGDGALLVVLPHRAISIGLGIGGYGWMVAAITGGELVGSLVLLGRPWRFPLAISIVIAQLAAAMLVLGVLVDQAVVVLSVLILFGICTAPMTAWAQTLRMMAVPPEQRGRLFALLRTLMQATPPVGAWLAGIALGRGAGVGLLAVTGVMAIPALVLAPDLVGFHPSGQDGVPDRI